MRQKKSESQELAYCTVHTVHRTREFVGYVLDSPLMPNLVSLSSFDLWFDYDYYK